MSLGGSSAESVRVICRFRPHREQLLRGGAGQGSARASKDRLSAGPDKPRSSDGILGATGMHNPQTGFKVEYAPDGKGLAFTPSAAAGGVRGRPHQFNFDGQ